LATRGTPSLSRSVSAATRCRSSRCATGHACAVADVPGLQARARRRSGPEHRRHGGYSPPCTWTRRSRRILHAHHRAYRRRMAREGAPTRGILYAGLNATERGRWCSSTTAAGDPEAELLLPRMRATSCPGSRRRPDGALPPRSGPSSGGRNPAVTVVVASRGYPGVYETGRRVDGLAEAARFRAPPCSIPARSGEVGRDRDGRRPVLSVTGWQLNSMRRSTAYEAVARFVSMVMFRRDIGLAEVAPGRGAGEAVSEGGGWITI